ncbi:MAG: hypothetical protein ACYS6W_04570 [Planctomycetota bacterium]
MASETGKKLSLGKRVAGFLLIVLVMIVSFTVTISVIRLFSGPRQPDNVPETPGMVTHVVLMFLVGNFSLGAGILVYVLTLITKCFTFDFRRPFWNSFKKKLYVMHIAVTVLIGLGVAAFVSMVVTPILMALGLPWLISLLVPGFGTFALVQFLFIWINMWRPLEKGIVKKMIAAYGISQEDIGRGICIGISDPSKSSLKKLTMVEEDVGMLWLEADELVYRGDSDSFRIGRDQLIEIERAVDPGSMSAYGGNVDVILRFKMANGTERRIRLHCESGWTLASRAKASDAFAERLICWQQKPSYPKEL